jgi:hypothetical protein
MSSKLEMEKVIFQPNKQGHQQSSPNFKRFTKNVTVNGEGERERERERERCYFQSSQN